MNLNVWNPIVFYHKIRPPTILRESRNNINQFEYYYTGTNIKEELIEKLTNRSVTFQFSEGQCVNSTIFRSFVLIENCLQHTKPSSPTWEI